jgi:hypothetical protein
MDINEKANDKITRPTTRQYPGCEHRRSGHGSRNMLPAKDYLAINVWLSLVFPEPKDVPYSFNFPGQLPCLHGINLL